MFRVPDVSGTDQIDREIRDVLPQLFGIRVCPVNIQQVVKTFDCEHISGFFRYPEEYTTAVVEFLTNN